MYAVACDRLQVLSALGLMLGESIYDQKLHNPKQIDTKGFLTDFGRNCRVK